MKWIVWLSAAAAALLISIVWAILKAAGKYRRGRFLSPFNVLFLGVFLSTVLALIPIYGEIVGDASSSALKTVMFSLHHTFQMFTIDADREFILSGINCPDAFLQAVYSGFFSVIIIIAPIFTFGFVITLFKNLSAYLRYVIHCFSDTYIFSQLNERSLTLGADIKRNHKRTLLVYTSVGKDGGDGSGEMTERARELRAVCFKKDVLSVNFDCHGKRSPMTFFMIGDDETGNASQALKLINIYKNRENTRMYVFSANTESELLLNSARINSDGKANNGEPEKFALKIRRVNKIRSVINEMLYSNGQKLFDEAKPGPDGIKTVSAVIVGTGQFGTEMLKALTWYCQMDGYRIKINAFDRDKHAKDRFSAAAPELMDEKYNGKSIDGEAEYEIIFHPRMKTGTKSFEDEISKIEDVTFAFVSLGDDEENIKAAAELRVLFERMKIRPRIQTVVFDSDEKRALEGAVSFDKREYGIEFTGDIESSYSEAVIMNSELEKKALERHLKWGAEEDFFRYEYNYNSSVASAIHMKARIGCGIPGADKKEKDLTKEERDTIERLEHRRWNAYMRSEGYIYSGSKDKASRNDLGKMHHDLVDYGSLARSEKRKDSKVGTE